MNADWNWTACADFPTGVELADARPPRTVPACRRQRVLPSPCQPRLRRNGIVYCCVQCTDDTCLTMHCQWGWLSRFSFLSLLTLTFDPDPKFELGWDFCAMHLTAKFHHPMFNRSEAIVLANWQTNRRRWKHPPRSAMLRRWVTNKCSPTAQRVHDNTYKFTHW